MSIPTRTDDKLRGPDWGAGASAVVSGNFTESLSFAGIAGNHWSFDGKFNTATIQPMLYYNIDSIPGAVLAYNAPITADWKASSSKRWTLPLGMTVGRTFSLDGGAGLDVSAGTYYNVVRPDGAAKWQIRFGITYLLP